MLIPAEDQADGNVIMTTTSSIVSQTILLTVGWRKVTLAIYSCGKAFLFLGLAKVRSLTVGHGMAEAGIQVTCGVVIIFLHLLYEAYEAGETTPCQQMEEAKPFNANQIWWRQARALK